MMLPSKRFGGDLSPIRYGTVFMQPVSYEVLEVRRRTGMARAVDRIQRRLSPRASTSASTVRKNESRTVPTVIWVSILSRLESRGWGWWVRLLGALRAVSVGWVDA
jgi:hypothetical protein